MQTCAECGKPISPKIGPPVLLNGNVVCQPCWQKAGAEAAAAPPARASAAASRSAPTARRTTGSTPAAPPRRHTSTTPAARRSSSRSESTSRRDPEKEIATAPSRATSRTATMIEELESSTSSEKLKLYMIGVMCVLIIGAGIAGYLWWSKTTRDAQQIKQAQDEAEAAIAAIRNAVKKDPDDFAAIKKALDDNEPKLKGHQQYRSEAASIRSDVIAREQAAATKRENLKLLEDLKKEIDDPAKRSTLPLLIARARTAGNAMGKEYMEEVNNLSMKLTVNVLKDGVDAAQAKEASNDLPGALALYDEAVIKFNKEFDKMNKVEGDILTLYKGLLAESDKLVDRVETPEFEASTPEKNMLSPKERALWGKSEGLEYTFQGSELELRGVEGQGGRKVTGVASFGLVPAAPWHDLIMDLNFTIVSGDFELYLRYWPAKKWFTIKFDPKSGYDLNKPYQMTLRVKGSKIELIAPDQNPQVDQLTVSTSRTGGVGFGLNQGSKVIISSCKVKVLRPRS